MFELKIYGTDGVLEVVERRSNTSWIEVMQGVQIWVEEGCVVQANFLPEEKFSMEEAAE